MKNAKYTPFTAHKKGSVRAHGKVSEVRVHEDGKSASVTVRHEAPPQPKTKKGEAQATMAFDSYPQETRAVMPAEHAKRFTVGSPMCVQIGPAGEAEYEPDGDEAPAKKAPKKIGSLIDKALAKRGKKS